MTRINHTLCPFCFYEHNRSSAITSGQGPAVEPIMRPGDVTMCIACGEFSVMGISEMLRKPTRTEARDLNKDGAVRHLRGAWQASRARSR